MSENVPERRKEEKPKDLPLSKRGMVARSVNDLWRLAKAMVQGGIAPKGMAPETALGVMLAGAELGLGHIQSLQVITFINGKPCLWGDGITALLLQSGLLQELPKEWVEGEGDNRTAYCELKRKGVPGIIRRQFSVGDARKAGLLSKDNWQKYQDRMLNRRAYGFAARDGFSDVLKGVWIREEAEDMEYTTVEQMPTPQEVPQPDAEADSHVRRPKEKSKPEPAPEPQQIVDTQTAMPDIDTYFSPAFDAKEEPEPERSENPHRVYITQEEEPTGERAGLWADWEQYRSQLTAEQLKAVRSKSGVGKIRADITLDNLRAVVQACEEVLGV